MLAVPALGACSFDKTFCETAPQLAADYCAPAVLSDDLFSLLGQGRPDWRWLIIGPAKSGSRWGWSSKYTRKYHYGLDLVLPPCAGRRSPSMHKTSCVQMSFHPSVMLSYIHS
jgi:hypothetical protein